MMLSVGSVMILFVFVYKYDVDAKINNTNNIKNEIMIQVFDFFFSVVWMCSWF
jgi:hypothetical protein